MIAHVYVLARMPRQTHVFDYEIPPSCTNVVRGSCVVIPFRHRTLYGIVARVSDKPMRGIKLKQLHAMEPRIRLRERELVFFETLAKQLAQSVSSMLFHALPSIPKRSVTAQKNGITFMPLTIRASEADTLLRSAKEMALRSRAFVCVPDVKRACALLACYLREKPKQKCVVITPTIFDAHLLASHLQGFHPWLLTSAQRESERFAIWNDVRVKKQGLLIGTRPALLCADQTTSTIILWRSGHNGYHYHEQNPRCDARSVAQEQSNQFETNLFFLDLFARVDDLVHFPESHRIGQVRPHEDVTLISTQQESLGKKSGSIISHRAFECMEQIIKDGGRILCVSNKKIEKNLQQLFPNIRISLLDKEHPHMDLEAQVVIATRFFLERFDPFQPQSWNAIILLDADGPLFQGGIRAVERVCYELEEWRAVAYASRSPLLVQTQNAALFEDYLSNPHDVMVKEEEMRCLYRQPPLWHTATLQFPKREKHEQAWIRDGYQKRLRQISQEVILQPMRAQKKNHEGLEVRFLEKDREALLSLFRTFPDHVMIDTQADAI